MKKTLVSLLLVTSALLTYAQDVITTRTGEEIQSKVLKISDSEVEYKKWNNQDGPTFVMGVDKVFMVKYQNGEKQVFGGNATANENSVPEVTEVKKKGNTFQKRRFNLDLGYSAQNLRFASQNGVIMSWCGDKRFSNGLLLGLSWDGDIGKGWGYEYCAFGLEAFFEKTSGSDVYEGIPYTYEESFVGRDIYFSPIKLQYRYEFGKDFAVYALTGPTLDLALAHTYSVKVHMEGESAQETQSYVCGKGELRHPLYIDWDFKCAFSYKIFKLQVGTSLGINNISGSSSNRVTVRRPLYVMLTFAFNK